MDNKESDTNEKLFDNRISDIQKNVDNSNPSNQKKLCIIVSIVVVSLLIAGLIIAIILTSSSDSSENYDPIPKKEDLNFTEEEHKLLSRNVASQGMVLATNNGNGLPLQKTDQIVLFGKGTNSTVYGGWGSGEVYSKGTTTNIVPVQVLEGIENKKDRYTYIENLKGYELGSSGLTEEDIQNFATKTSTEIKRSIAILTISRRSGEGSDRSQSQAESGTLLTDAEVNTYNALIKYFDNVIVVLNVGGVMELGDIIPYNEKTSVLISFLPGMEAGNAIADVLVGDVNPSGKLTDTWAKTIDDYSTTATFKENISYVKYTEGLFMGYRYFEDDEEKQKKVLFPFGYGLSYTTFDVKSDCKYDSSTKQFKITSTVKNTGNTKGKHVVQTYVSKQQNEKFIKVKRELVAFAKTKELEPNEETKVTMTFGIERLSSYDDIGVFNKGCYVIEKGQYKIFVGDSVADTRDENKTIYTYEQKELQIIEKLQTRLKPKDPDVLDANTKPNFEEIMKPKNTKTKINENKQVIKKEPIRQSNEEDKDNDAYQKIPSSKINEINFREVIRKKYSYEELVDTMTNEELAFISYGHSANVRSGTGTIGGLFNSGLTGKYLIPSGDTNDGPAGLRQSEVSLGSTAWPCSTLLASTWDAELVQKVGEEVGKEARKIGCSFWLAPGMNIHRSPLCGRNFEYYSEDPILTGKLAAAITKGVQSKRVSITIKHFCVNNKEENRNGDSDKEEYLASDSRMAERVAREIYLKGFEIAVKEGKAWSIMTSYNRINGMKTAESYDLLTGILRDEWKFDGLVMTDWGTNSNHARETHAGNSVKMPSNGDGINTIIQGIESGLISRNELKTNAIYILKTLGKTACIDQLFKNPNPYVITKEKNRIKVYDYIFDKSEGVSYEPCEDEDKGYIPTHSQNGQWITIYVSNEKEGYRTARIRYAGYLTGFGVAFKKDGKNLGEITNLEKTGGWQVWNTSPDFTLFLPKGTYELTLFFLGYDYGQGDLNKGNINWIEIE